MSHSIILDTVAHEEYFRQHQTPHWSMKAVDLIHPQYQPKLLETRTFKYHQLQLVQFHVKEQMYYAIFYVELDGYLPRDILAFHEFYADGGETFVTTEKDQATRHLSLPHQPLV